MVDFPAAREGWQQLYDACRAERDTLREQRGRLIEERNQAERGKLEAEETIGELSEQLQAEYRDEAALERRAEVAEARVEALQQALTFYAAEATCEESSEPHPTHLAEGIVPIEADRGARASAALTRSGGEHPDG